MAKSTQPPAAEPKAATDNRIETLARQIFVDTLARQRLNAIGDEHSALNAIEAAEAFYRTWDKQKG